jgi:predicted nucleic-acid-binding Zn-ribbon protein
MLLGIPNALHFNFQCNACGTVANGVLLSTIAITQVIDLAPGDYALSYTCLICGFTECFNSNLPSADVITPGNHGTQAQLIRQAQTFLLLQKPA